MADHVSLDIERLSACLGESHSQKNGTGSSLQIHHQQSHQHQYHQCHHLAQEHPTKSSPKSQQQQQDECRICQEEDEAGNLEIPCSCCGSLKYAHRKCVQRWCNEKGDTICEICQQPFKGYTAPVRSTASPAALPDEPRNGEWRGHPLDPRLMAMAAERHLLQEIDDYAAANASGAACCRSAALILMALLLLRHTLALGAAGSDEDTSTFFTLFFLRAAGFLLPCYIMARAMNILQRRRQRQEWSSAARGLQILDPSPSQSQRMPFLNMLASARG